MEKTLIGLVNECAHVESLVTAAYQETGGEITPATEELEAYYEDVAANVKTKATQCYHLMAHLDSREAFYNDLSKQFYAQAARVKAARERVKSIIKYAMEHDGLKELQGNGVRFVLAKTAPALDIDQEALHSDWWKTVTTRSPDNARIKNALKDGIEVPGAKLVHGHSLRSYVGGSK